MVDNLTDGSQKVWIRIWLNVAGELNGLDLGAHAPMVKDDKRYRLFDPGSNKISLPDALLAATAPMLDALAFEARCGYSGNEVLRTPTEEEVDCTLKCLMVKKGSHAKLIAKWMRTGILELVSEKQKDINGLFGVQRTGDNQRLILYARRANLHFTASQDPELPHV